jgi:hypothetical protein
MAGNLTPTLIVNKNGVTTTVHRRVLSSGSFGFGSMPAPQVNDTSLDTAEIEKIVRESCTGDPNVNLKKWLEGFSEKTLSRLVRFFAAEGASGSETQVVARLLHRGASEETISDAMNFLPGNPRMYNQILSIRYYIEFAHLPVDEIEKGSRDHEQVMALLGMVEPARIALGVRDRDVPIGSPLIGISLHSGDHIFIFRDDRVIRSILENSDKRDLIRRVIEDHGTVHHETIRDALGIGSALGVGTL